MHVNASGVPSSNFVISPLFTCLSSLADSLHATVQSQQPAGQQRPYNPSPYLPPPSVPVPQNQAQPTVQPPVRQNNLHHTTTVRNLVNLKKQTLTLTPRKDDPETLDLSFCIDAVQECMYDVPHSYSVVFSLAAFCHLHLIIVAVWDANTSNPSEHVYPCI